MDVLLTIDTETHRLRPDWKQDNLAADMARDLYGQVDGHTFGLDHQLDIFARHRLKANFMVESLFAGVPEVGAEPLKKIVHAIRERGHDIQLHPHPEWLGLIPDLDVPFRSHLLHAYPQAEQEAIIRFATRQLQHAGAPPPIAFRAGGFAANADTLAALKSCGIPYDSSFNLCYRHPEANMPFPRHFGQASEYNGVHELPISVFQDYPLHFRPAQLCACSSAEMVHALNRAEAEGWHFFVIVSHSFEMIKNRRHRSKPPAIHWDVVARFKALCEFLDANRDRFPTIGFSDLNLTPANHRVNNHIKGKLSNTARRVLQQAKNRI